MLVASWNCSDTPHLREEPSGSSLDVSELEIERFCGHPVSEYTFVKSQIDRNENLSDILLEAQLTYRDIHELGKNTKKVFHPRNLRAGKPYTLLYSDTCTAPDYMIYELSDTRYLEYDLQCKEAAIIKRPIRTDTAIAKGSIQSSLWESLASKGYPPALIYKMEDALAWTVDFYHLQKNDSFLLVYETLCIEGVEEKTGKLLGAYFKSGGNEAYSIYYQSDNYKGFFDLEGRPMKKAFLKSPVRYSRISSRYNPRRYHPIRKKVTPHLGTDYAAPRGTPIRSVAGGRVVEASYTRGNGNYVKVRHDRTYTTQYLHMTRFANGIRPGKVVEQGETIGYVGSTGLSTGPHVCFRFWKNGRQVDHLRENLPPPEPMDAEELPQYFTVRDEILQLLDPNRMKGPLTEQPTHQHSSSAPQSNADRKQQHGK